ncbi:inner membrane transport permease YbhS [Anaerolineaceae bacterium]|nr:inner membrane transport permease YbhS [Anaerolineaceae bacterium]
MNLTRLLALMRKEGLQIMRDRRTLALVFIMPIMQLLLLGYAATSDVRNIPLAVLDQDKSPASRKLLDSFRTADYFRQAFDVTSEDELRTLIDSGHARTGLIIPPDYSSRLAAGRPAQVAFIIDGSDPAIAGTALAAATLIGQARATALTVERLAARGMAVAAAPAIEVRARVWYNPDLISAYYMIPALVGLILQFLTVILTATAIVRERERGTIEQLIVTPLTGAELIVGKLAPYVLIAFIDTLLILAGGVLLFGVPINGSLPLLLLLSALFLVTNLALGLLISTVAGTQQEAIIFALFYNLPSIFLSGFIYPVAAMPRALQLISYAIPLRYFLIVVRGIVLKAVGVAQLWPEIIALSIFAVVVITAAATRFQKRLD